jgi:metal-dependent amidase/aminoacylase/carboxypeptidase family protein
MHSLPSLVSTTWSIDERRHFRMALLIGNEEERVQIISVLLLLQPQTVAEDFSEYGEVTPSLFVFLGNWSEDMDPTQQPTNHSPHFDMHEPYLERGVRSFVHMVVDYLQAQP